MSKLFNSLNLNKQMEMQKITNSLENGLIFCLALKNGSPKKERTKNVFHLVVE